MLIYTLYVCVTSWGARPRPHRPIVCLCYLMGCTATPTPWYCMFVLPYGVLDHAHTVLLYVCVTSWDARPRPLRRIVCFCYLMECSATPSPSYFRFGLLHGVLSHAHPEATQHRRIVCLCYLMGCTATLTPWGICFRRPTGTCGSLVPGRGTLELFPFSVGLTC